MQTVVKSKLAILSEKSDLTTLFAEHEPVTLTLNEIKNTHYAIDILIIDGSAGFSGKNLDILSGKKNKEFAKIIYLLEEKSNINIRHFIQIKCDFYLYKNEISSDFLHKQWQNLTQKEQDEAYLSLSTELNQQYETLKTELEIKLFEKTKNLIESRKQVFEINNRVEILRKSLFATTEVKSLPEAENILNDLLVGFNLVTWLKIIKIGDVQQFESELKTHFDSSFYSSTIKINAEEFNIYFFKGDRRAFKKKDLNFFSKLSESLQINLNRYNNLLLLQQNERLFDLAFHSSPQPIIILDKDYHVFQANLAAEQKADAVADTLNNNLKCYELLFNRTKPCTSCQLGTKFEVQQDIKTYRVQSNKFNNSMTSNNHYWIHFYEDISEQKALESKFQQTARLSELGLVSSSIAHELNNPLGGILSYLQIMKMELPATHPFISDIQILIDAANRMKKHIEDLLFFSRKEDLVKLEKADIHEIIQKNLDLMQLQLKKDHLTVVYQPTEKLVLHDISVLHFRNTIHLVFQFLLHKLKMKKQSKPNFSGLVEVKISQDQINTYVSFSANLGPHNLKLNSNDLSLITLEKSILNQKFQLVISEPQPLWLQLLIKLPF